MHLELICHPDTPAKAVTSVEVWLRWDNTDALELDYIVTGGKLAVPDWTEGQRTDELWKTTCFELFFQPQPGEGYYEFNFSPSSNWAAYAFDSYRAGMRVLEEAENPDIRAFEGEKEYFSLIVEPWPAALVQGRGRANITAVIEEADGTKSYWALAHPAGKPDFHDPACFVLELPAADAA